MMLKIVTHSGKAHRDEFLSIALLMASSEEEVVIQRKNAPADWELKDKDIWVLDVGGSHDPKYHNYDHHTAGNPPAVCTLSLLGDTLEYKGVKVVDLLKESKWWKTACLMDNIGMTGVAEYLEISKDSIMSLSSPIESALLAQFGRRELWTRGYIVTAMREIGRDLLGYLYHSREQMTTLEAAVKVVTWGGQKCLLLENTDTTGLGRYREEKHPDASISISLNKRGEGWALYRYDDHPAVNFSLLKDTPEVSFAHQGGFLAITQTKIPQKELKKLVTSAVVTAE
jgi:hypothetical protein